VIELHAAPELAAELLAPPSGAPAGPSVSAAEPLTAGSAT
jgi:hypothetical protein